MPVWTFVYTGYTISAKLQRFSELVEVLAASGIFNVVIYILDIMKKSAKWLCN
jgi:hypothetical protein